MHELGVDLDTVRALVQTDLDSAIVRLTVPPESRDALVALMSLLVRRCYVADEAVVAAAGRAGIGLQEAVEAKLPDRGATMAGDFGEMLTALALATLEEREVLVVKRWRLGVGRNRSAPFSDVVQIQLPNWPDASPEDKLLCAEVKTKSTKAASTPIPKALADSTKDETARLAKTLVWLRERGIYEDLGSVEVAMVERFIDAVSHPTYERVFRAVAVICSDFVDAEIDGAELPEDESRLIVIDVDRLKDTYQEVYAAISSADLRVPQA
jgi:hypothetical protein